MSAQTRVIARDQVVGHQLSNVDRPSTKQLIALVLIFLAVASVFAGGSDPSRTIELLIYPCAFSAYVVALLLLTYGDRPSLGLAEFSLGAWMLGFAAVAYGLATTSLLLPKSDDELRVGSDGTVPQALLLVALGFTAFAVGNRLGPTRLARRLSRTLFGWRNSPQSIIATDGALVVVYGLGLVATGLKIYLEGGYGYVGGATITGAGDVAGYSQILTIGTFLRTAAIYGFAARWASTPSIASAVRVTIMFAIEAALGILFATKESFVVAALAALIPLVLLRTKRIPWRLVLLGAVLFVFVVTPLVTALRAEIRQGDERLDASSSLRIGVSTLTGGGNSDVASLRQQATSRIASRIRLLDNQLVIMDKTPEVYAFRSKSELAAAPIVALIPRAIWPSKPVRLSGAEFYKTYYQGQGISSSALTFQGSLFLYGGAVPALLGMLVLGSLIRGLDDTLREFGALQGGLIALIIFVPIVKQELDVVSLIASVPVLILTYYLARRAVLRPDPAAPAGAA